MNPITRFFAHAESLSADIERLHDEHEDHMQDYFRSFGRKKELSEHEFTDLTRIKLAAELAHEMPLAEQDEATEDAIIADLRNYGYERRVEGLQQLVEELNNYQSKEAYVHKLMRRVYEILKDEAVILQRLEKNPTNKELHEAFRMNITHEEELLTQLRGVGKEFKDIYKRLALGERNIHALHAHEHDIAQDIWNRMRTEIVRNGASPLNEDAFHVLTVDCFHQFDIELEKEMQANRIGHTFQAPFDYLHSRLFEQFVRELIKNNRIELEHSEVQQEDAIRIFIILFRDFFTGHLRGYGQ